MWYYFIYHFIVINVKSEKQMSEHKQRESDDMTSLITTKEGEKLI